MPSASKPTTGMRITMVSNAWPFHYGVLALLFFVAPLIPLLRGTTLDYLVDRQAWAWLYAVNIYHAEHGEWSLSYINHARRPLLPGLNQ